MSSASLANLLVAILARAVAGYKSGEHQGMVTLRRRDEIHGLNSGVVYIL
jgi:hypothetical protein